MEAPVCERCTLDFNLYPRNLDGTCPNCGARSSANTSQASEAIAQASVDSPKSFSPLDSVASYLATLKEIIFSPTKFFKDNATQMISPDGIAQVLTFALITDWLSTFINFLWRTLAGAAFERVISTFVQMANEGAEYAPGAAGQNFDMVRARLTEFLFGAGSIILAPFTMLIRLGVGALVIHVAVRLFFRNRHDRPQTYLTTLKILCYATAPALLCIVPGVGVLASWILGFAVSVIGFREVYRGTTFRATMAVMFPSLVVIGIMMMVLMALIILGVSVFQFIT